MQITDFSIKFRDPLNVCRLVYLRHPAPLGSQLFPFLGGAEQVDDLGPDVAFEGWCVDRWTTTRRFARDAVHPAVALVVPAARVQRLHADPDVRAPTCAHDHAGQWIDR